MSAIIDQRARTQTIDNYIWMTEAGKIFFRETGVYIHSSAADNIDVYATEINLHGNVNISGGGGVITDNLVPRLDDQFHVGTVSKGWEYIVIAAASALDEEPQGLYLDSAMTERMYSYANEIIWDIDDTGELKLSSAALYPYANAGLNLGSDANEFNDIWIDGVGYFDAITMHGTITMSATADIDLANNTIFVDDAGDGTNPFLSSDSGDIKVWTDDTSKSFHVVGYNAEAGQLGPNLKIIADAATANDVPAIAFYTSSGGLADTQLGSMLGDNANFNIYAFPQTYSMAFLTWDNTGDGVGAKLWIRPSTDIGGGTYAADIDWWSNAWHRVYSDEGVTEVYALDGQTGTIYVRGSILDGDVGTNDIGGSANEFQNIMIKTDGRYFMADDQNEWMKSTGSDIRWGVANSDEMFLSGAALGPVAAGGLALGGVNNEWSHAYFLDNAKLFMASDQQEWIYGTGSDVRIGVGNADEIFISTTAVGPVTDDGSALGAVNNNWSDAYFADAAVIYFGDDQDVTLTHVADTGLVNNLNFTTTSLTLDLTQDYLFTSSGNHLAVQAQTDDTNADFAFFSKKGDGGDAVQIRLYGIGTPGSVGNSEELRISYLSGTGFQISTQEAGTGIVQPLDIFTKGNADQLLLNIDGSVSFSGQVELTVASHLQFRDAALYIASLNDGYLDIVADTQVRITSKLYVSDDVSLPTNKEIQFRDLNILIRSDDDGHLDLYGDVSVDVNSPLLNVVAATFSGLLDANAGADIEGEVTIDSTSLTPLILRHLTAAGGGFAGGLPALNVIADSGNTIGNGFGAEIKFYINSSGDVDNKIAVIRGFRDGDDTSGGFRFYTDDGDQLALTLGADKSATFGAGATFAGNVLMGTDWIQFWDSSIKVYSAADGKLSLNSDGTIDFNTPIAALYGTNRLQFRDSAIYINSRSDGNLSLWSDSQVEHQTPLTFFSNATGDSTLLIRSTPDNAHIELDSGDDGTTESSIITFSDDRVAKWQFIKGDTNLFRLYDSINDQDVLSMDASAATVVSTWQNVTHTGVIHSGDLKIMDNLSFQAGSNDADFIKIRARDTGVGYVQIGSITGAADPYVGLGGADNFKFYASGNMQVESTAHIYFNDTNEYVYSDTGKLIFGSDGGDRFAVDSGAVYPIVADSLFLGGTASEWHTIHVGTGGIYFYPDQHERMYSDGSNLNYTIASTLRFIMSDNAFFPNANKTYNLGGASNRWGASWIGSNTTGTSRTVRSNIRCEDHPEVYCIKGTGGVILTAYRWDYQMVFCPICGKMYAEKTDYSDENINKPVPDPDRMVLRDIKYTPHGAWGMMAELQYDYHIDDRIEQNATYLGVKEYEDFEAMAEEEQVAFITRLGLIEWKSHVRSQRMEKLVAEKTRKVEHLVGIELKI